MTTLMPRARPALVAQTIATQLGGSRFLPMTGAHWYAVNGSLVVELPNARAANSIKRVLITLAADDTYTVQFCRREKPAYMPVQWVLVHEATGVYGDALQECFTSRTGLDTHL